MTEPLPGIAQQQQNVDVSALRESMMNRQQARPRKNRHRASILLSKDGFSRGKHTKQMEDKLGEQFKYFRQEFLDAALSVGVPVPLDMVEDKAGRVFTFVNQKGPRYLFQIMHSNPESPHLLRCSLSLLIVTISILRGKLPQTSSITNEKSAHVWLSLLTENVSAWALDSLTTIADGSAVAICTNLLRHSHSQTIQELILNLLAHLVNITEEAANQMLLYPTITSSDTPQKPQDVKDLDQDRGAATPMGRPLLSETQSSRRSELPSVRSLVGHAREKKANSVENDDNFTCLSYMFSVVAHHRNRYTVMTACAEVVLALVANKSALICEEIARTAISPVIMDTFTGEQRTTSNRNFGGNRGHMKPSFGGNASSTANGTLRMKSTASPPAEWAALKLMLKFLQRFMRYAQSAVQDDNSTVTSADSTANRSPAQTPGSRIRCNVDIAVVPHKHKNSLCTAHARVLLAVCELIIYSPNVASFVLTMPGARAIMKASCMLHKDSPDIGQSVVQCLHVLQRESERVYEIMSSNRHSMSYELTHGRASKLFNPVSALTSKRVGLRSSAGSRQKRATTPGQRTADRRTPEKQTSPQRSGTNPFTSEFTFSEENGKSVDILVVHRDDDELGDVSATIHEDEGDGMHINPALSEVLRDKALLLTCKKNASMTMRSRSRSADTGLSLQEDSFDDDGDNDDWLRTDSPRGLTKKPSFASCGLSPLPPQRKVPSEQENRNSRGMSAGSDWSQDDDESINPKLPGRKSACRVPSYRRPDSPSKRGVQESGCEKSTLKEAASLHRDLFSALPDTPTMPARLEANDIISGVAAVPNSSVSRMSYIDASMKQSLSISSQVVASAVNEGFYSNGKSSIPIVEKARRVYSRKARPKTSEELIRSSIESFPRKLHTSSGITSPVKLNQTSKHSPPNARPQTSSGERREGKVGGLLLDGLGGLEEGVSEFQMFMTSRLNEGRARTAPGNEGGSLSEGRKNNQVLQSLDMLFP